MIKTYSELSKLKSFNERFKYLKLEGFVGVDTFGRNRYINQNLYRSKKWKRLRDQIIIRDNGCDLGILDYVIVDMILIHHINPISQEDIESENSKVFDEDNLICTSLETHNAIHFGNELKGKEHAVERKPNDTCMWR